MVSILYRLVKQTVCFIKNSQILLGWQRTMAWRSIGSDNADLINQLEGNLVHQIFEQKTTTNTSFVILCLEYHFDIFGDRFIEPKIERV